MGRSRVRLKDIASQTGFSTNTVSLALRKSPRIPEATRNLIRETADRLNYVPNQIAKSLVNRETMTIGLILTDIRNPTLNQTAQALEVALSEKGYSTLFATSNNTLDHEISAINVFRSRQVDGILVYPASHKETEHIRALRRAGFPIVQLVPDADGGVDAIAIDDRKGAEKATRHLLELGHRRIGFLDTAQGFGNLEKLDGYKSALADHGVPFDATLTHNPQGHSATQGFGSVDTLLALPNPPTAIFCTTDSLALGVMRRAISKGLRIPQDIAVVGFDNIELGAFASVPVTTINYAAQQVSQLAVERLLSLISAGDVLPPPQTTLIDPDLVIRDSTVAPT